MKTFNQWLATASPAIKELPEVAVRAIFEAGQDNPDINRLCKFTDKVLERYDGYSILDRPEIAEKWEQAE